MTVSDIYRSGMLNIFIAFFALIGLQDVVIAIAGWQRIDPTIYALPIIAVHAILTFAYVLTRKERGIAIVLAIGLALRIVLLFVDYLHLAEIPNSGADSEAFHRIALLFYRNISFETKMDFPKVVGMFYSFTYASRLLAQYVNVIFGMGIIIMVYKSLKLLRVNPRAIFVAVTVIALLPNAIIFSGILLREAWVEFFVAVSAFYFVKWFTQGGAQNIVGCIAMLLAASYMHAGVLGLFLGYIAAFLFYNPATGRVRFTTSSVLSMIVISGIWFLIADSFEMFTGKFNDFSFEDNSDFLQKVNKVGGGNSDYLTWIDADSTVQGLLFSPLKMFYFLFSPLPTEWNRMSDIVGFAIDGAIYMWMCWIIWKYRPGRHLMLKRFVVIAMLCSAFIFGYGTFNAGTAFRHRAKLIAVIAIPFAISLSEGKYRKPVAQPFSAVS